MIKHLELHCHPIHPNSLSTLMNVIYFSHKMKGKEHSKLLLLLKKGGWGRGGGGGGRFL